jgi:hypothetical protein
MESTDMKPRLIFFQYWYDSKLPEFLLIHKRDHIRCLAEFFDVTTIDYDCDYEEVCARYGADVALFESEYNVSFSYCRRPRIVNTRACPQIPKLGFLHTDSFSQGRAGFLSDMDHLGIETFFANCTTLVERVPEISNALFTWPNFIDGEIYRDYQGWKSIPVLFTGNRNFLYPWRRKICALVSEHYPALICPHPGFGFAPAKAVIQAPAGEQYARMLNASWFVPACGTVAKEVVRKHFEAPGCKACLITEKSATLEAAGFVDMANCVFADESNILDKLEHLFRNPDVLNNIINAGYHLVHARHTLKHRDQILQWFNLNKGLRATEKIVQTGPFGPLRVVEKSVEVANGHVIGNGLDVALLRQGDQELWKGDYERAEKLYLRCVNYIPWMPEPQMRLALCNLYQGNAKRALSWIVKPLVVTLEEYRAADPDPVEWAYFIITLLCLGRLGAAAQRARQFEWLHHLELDRARWVTKALTEGERAGVLGSEDAPKYRVSIHRLPHRELEEWIRHICVMLGACGQRDLAEKVTACTRRDAVSLQKVQSEGRAKKEATENGKRAPDKKLLRRRHIMWVGAGGYFARLHFCHEARIRLKNLIKGVLHRLEEKWRNFLPYRLSRRKKDEFFCAVQGLAQEMKTALIIGAARREGPTEALLAGARENTNNPSVMCLQISREQRNRFERISQKQRLVKWYDLSFSSPEHVSEELESRIKEIKEENRISFFDVLLIDGSELADQLDVADTVAKELHASRLVILDDINEKYNHRNYDVLVKYGNYVLADYNPSLRNGYAIFERQGSARGKPDGAMCSASELAEWSNNR